MCSLTSTDCNNKQHCIGAIEGQYCAKIKVNGENIHLGFFRTYSESYQAFIDAKVKFGVNYEQK